MSNWHYIKHFFNHRLKSQTLNDIHSPFVFDLTTKVFREKVPFYCFFNIEKERQKLLQNDTILQIEDFGAGSKVFNSNHRKISAVAKISLKPAKQAQLLFRLATFLNHKEILELGTSFGISTAYLATSRKSANVTTIEGSPEIAQQAAKVFKKLKLDNITQLVGNFDEELPKFLASSQAIDMIFIDGNHKKAPTLSYFNQCLQKIHNDSLIIFDDIYWSQEMTEAWEEIKQHPKTQITIDLFHLGLVFFRKEQPKQHFKIKF